MVEDTVQRIPILEFLAISQQHRFDARIDLQQTGTQSLQIQRRDCFIADDQGGRSARQALPTGFSIKQA